MEEIREIIEDGWEKPERKARIQNRFAKLYPFKPSDATFWETELGGRCSPTVPDETCVSSSGRLHLHF